MSKLRLLSPRRLMTGGLSSVNRALFITYKWIQRRHRRRAIDIDGVLELSDFRICVFATEPPAICLHMAIDKLIGTARENNAIAGKRVASADQLPGDIRRIAMCDL